MWLSKLAAALEGDRRGACMDTEEYEEMATDRQEPGRQF